MEVSGGLTRQEALLAAFSTVVGLALANYFYKAPLYRLHPIWFWTVDAVEFIAAPALAVLVLRRAGVTLADCGLAHERHRAAGNDWGFVLFVAFILATATWPVFRVAGLIFWRYAGDFSMQHALPAGAALKLVVAVYLSATAALVEEVAYRALPWLYFRDAVPPRWRHLGYVLGTSVVFAVAHSEQGPGGVIGAFWFGMVAALIYGRTRNLWPLVVGHFAVDMLVFGPW